MVKVPDGGERRCGCLGSQNRVEVREMDRGHMIGNGFRRQRERRAAGLFQLALASRLANGRSGFIVARGLFSDRRLRAAGRRFRTGMLRATGRRGGTSATTGVGAGGRSWFGRNGRGRTTAHDVWYACQQRRGGGQPHDRADRYSPDASHECHPVNYGPWDSTSSRGFAATQGELLGGSEMPCSVRGGGGRVFRAAAPSAAAGLLRAGPSTQAPPAEVSGGGHDDHQDQ
jgi:hypothetical protein